MIGEVVGARQNLATIWERIYHRLGKAVWRYLPPRSRRWPHNGKTYVGRALECLAQHGLIRQHIVRYQALHDQTIELFLYVTGPDAGVFLHELGRIAPLIDRYPTTDGYLVRALADHRVLKLLTRTTVPVQWWFVDEDRTRNAPSVRFQYERLFDLTTRSWVVP